MATVSPFLTPPAAPPGFPEALDGLIRGVAGLQLARSALAAALEQDEGAGSAQSLLDAAYHEGRLGADDYAALTADIDRYLGEDVPTEWSPDLVREAAPGSDTLAPGEAPDAGAARSGAGLGAGAVLMERFVLQARLGLTGTSDVFKAIDRHRAGDAAGDPWVALKLAVPGAPRYEQALRMLRQEAALAPALRHPHIARVYDFDQADGHAFLTMEWLDGESLADLLTRQRYRPLTVAHARQVLTEIADALEFAHSRGITHADVKPGNLFITRDGGAKLLDFGTARSSLDAPQPAEARTPAYASCEVLEGAPPTPQDDVYSLACVAYRMLAGRRAFGHHDALAAEQSGRRPAPIRGLSPQQWAALSRALAFRRAERTPDMAAFIADFNAAPAPATPAREPAPLAPPAAAATPAAAPVPAARGPLPRWLPRAVIAAALAALGLFSVLRLARAPRPPAPPPAAVAPAPAPVPALAPPAPAATAAAGATPVPAPAPPVAATRAPESSARRPRDAQPAAPAGQRRGAAPVATPGGDSRPAGGAPAANVAAPAPPPEAPAPAPAAEASAAAAAAPAPGAAPDEAPAPSVPAAADAGPRAVPLSDLNLRRYVKPAEPRGRRAAGGPGWVEIAFVVGTDGAPHDVRVTGSKPAGAYDEVALGAVKRWRFEPVLEDGRAVERRTSVRLRFQPAE